jgi:hypothetical protein
LDDPRDYQLLSTIFKKLYDIDNFFNHEMIINLLNESPELLKINSEIIRNEGYVKSILNDKLC